jgi:hypothetical protein
MSSAGLGTYPHSLWFSWGSYKAATKKLRLGDMIGLVQGHTVKWQKQDVNSIQEDEIKFFAFSVLSISFWKFNVWTPALDMKWDFKASFLYFQYYRTLKHFWKVCYWAEWNNDVSKIDTAKSKVWEALSVKRQVSEAAHIETNS